MLPPVTELKAQRRVMLTAAGSEAVNSAERDASEVALSAAEITFLETLQKKNGIPLAGSRLGMDAAGLQRLQRCGLIEIRENISDRKRRMQQVIAWKGASAAEK